MNGNRVWDALDGELSSGSIRERITDLPEEFAQDTQNLQGLKQRFRKELQEIRFALESLSTLVNVIGEQFSNDKGKITDRKALALYNTLHEFIDDVEERVNVASREAR